MGIIFNDTIKFGTDSDALPSFPTYGDLPALPTGSLAYVEENSGGYWSWKLLKKVWEYPRGIYIQAVSGWELYTQQVRMAEDSGTLLNVASYTEWLTVNEDVQQYAMKCFDRINYENLTGTYTTTEPSLDPINWEQKTFNKPEIKSIANKAALALG